MPVGWAIVVVALWLTVIALSAIVLALTRRVASLSRPAASPALAPSVGTVLTDLRDEGTGKWYLYLFLSTRCAPCRALMGELQDADWTLVSNKGIEVAVVADDVAATNAISAALPVVLPRSVTSDRFGVRATPYALVVDEASVVRAGRVPGSFDDLVEMVGVVDQATARTDLVDS